MENQFLFCCNVYFLGFPVSQLPCSVRFFFYLRSLGIEFRITVVRYQLTL